jgi:hypothetical protein
MEPITAIVTALALGAAAALKETTAQAIKDAYASLKAIIQSKYSKVAVAQLEEAPESKAHRAVIEEGLTKASAEGDEELLRQAKQLLDMIQKHAPKTAGAIGVDLEDVKGASLKIADVIATGAGVKARKVETVGDIDIRGVRAGHHGEDTPKG